MPSEPSRGGAGCGGRVWRAGKPALPARASSPTFSRKVADGHEEQIAGLGDAEIQQTVVIAGRAADEHVLQHLLDRPWRSRIADEIGAEFALRGTAERHVVAEDLYLLAVLDDGGQRVVRRGRLDGIVEFDVGELGAADDALLRLGRTARSSRPRSCRYFCTIT